MKSKMPRGREKNEKERFIKLHKTEIYKQQREYKKYLQLLFNNYLFIFFIFIIIHNKL